MQTPSPRTLVSFTQAYSFRPTQYWGLVSALTLLFVILSGCVSFSDDSKNPTETPVLEVGDFWVSYFDNSEFQNCVVSTNRLYCNTINLSRGDDFFYCLSLTTGKVIWKHPVENFASQAPMIINDHIFFSTYLGNLHYLDKNGHCIWQRQFELPYGGHFIDVSSGNPVVYSVTEGVWEYNKRNGQIIDRSAKLSDTKAYLREASEDLTPIRPYSVKVPSKNGIYVLDIRQESVKSNGQYEYVISARKLN